MKIRKHRILLLLIIFTGVLLRALYILQIRKSPFFYYPFGDPEVFDKWALSIAEGNFVGAEVFFKPPLYPYILAFFYRLFGHYMVIPRLLNILFDAGSTFIIYVIGRKIFNRAVGLISAAIFSGAGIIIYFSGEILGTSLTMFVSFVFLLLLLKSNGVLWRWLLTGFMLSIAIIVRPNFLLFIPIVIIYIFVKKGVPLIKAKAVLLFSFGVIAMILVTGVRNYIVGNDIVLVNYSAGVNFYIGNNRKSDGVSAVLPDYGNDWDEYSIAESAFGKKLKPSEVSRYWLVKGISFIVNHPVCAFKQYIKKGFLLFNGKEISNNQNIYFYIRNAVVTKPLLFLYGTKRFYFAFPSSVVFSLGIVGIFLSLITRKDEKVILYICLIFVYGFSVMLFFITSRYRMPVFAYIIPFSGYALYSFYKRIRSKKRTMALSGSILLLLFVFNIDPYGVSMKNKALEYYNLGNVFFKKGKLEKAEVFYKKGLEENNRFPRLHLNLGAIYLKKNELKKAEKEFKKEIDINPEEAKSYLNLARLYERRGLMGKAIYYSKKSIEKRVRLAEAYLNTGRLYVKEAKYDSAMMFLWKAADFKANELQVFSLLGFCNLRLGLFNDAIKNYRQAIKLNKDAYLYYNLAVAYIGAGRIGEAREALKLVISLKPDFAAAHYNLGLIFMKEDKKEKAKKEFEKVLQLQPSFANAKKMIEKIK